MGGQGEGAEKAADVRHNAADMVCLLNAVWGEALVMSAMAKAYLGRNVLPNRRILLRTRGH